MIPSDQRAETSLPVDDEAGGQSLIQALLLPNRRFIVAQCIVYANVAIYLAMVASGVHFFSPSGQDLIAWGSNFGPATLAGEWSRLLTSMFLHVGLIHLLFNMYALLYAGVLLEPLLGRFRFGVAYILCGIAGSLVSVWWDAARNSAGASGAVFGMYGMLAAILLFEREIIANAVKKQLLRSVAPFIGYNLLFGSIAGFIDNAAHIGGLLMGIVAGIAYVPTLKRTVTKAGVVSATAVLAVTALAGYTIFYQTLSSGTAVYEYTLFRFSVNEQAALSAYQNIVADTPAALNDAQLKKLQNDVIDVYRENMHALEELNGLDASQERRVKLLIEYCSLRMRSFELRLASFKEPDKYSHNNLETVEQKIETIMSEINALPE